MDEKRDFHQITPCMHVEDVEEAVRFFVDLLGFELKFQTPETYAYVSRGRVAVRIMKVSDDPNEASARGKRNFRYYIDVADVQAVVDEVAPKLKEHWPGRRVHGPQDQPYGQREYMIESPDGDLVVFGQEIGPAA